MFLLTVTAAVASRPFVSDSIANMLNGRTLDPAEGIWQWPDDGAVMLICRTTASSFSISLLDSPRAEIRPGTIVGKLIASPKAGEYDCHLDPAALGSGKARSSDCHVYLTDSHHLTFSPYRRNDTFSLRRLIPYLLRVGFLRSNRPSDIDGARRIYPEPTPLPFTAL